MRQNQSEENNGEDVEEMRSILETMAKVPAAANNMMLLGMLTGFHGSITAQGKLLQCAQLVVIPTDEPAVDVFSNASSTAGSSLMTETSFIAENSLQVFLFEQIVILARILKGFDGNDVEFVVKKQIKTNRMSLIPKLSGGSVGSGGGGGGSGGGVCGDGTVAAEAKHVDFNTETAPTTTTTPTTTCNNDWKIDNALVIWNGEEKDSSGATFHVLIFPTTEKKEEWQESLRSILRMQQDLVQMLQNPQESPDFTSSRPKRESMKIANARERKNINAE